MDKSLERLVAELAELDNNRPHTISLDDLEREISEETDDKTDMLLEELLKNEECHDPKDIILDYGDRAAMAVPPPKETLKIQIGTIKYDLADIRKAVEADYKSKVKGRIKTVDIFIKPEDKAVYYAVNGDFTDKIDL